MKLAHKVLEDEPDASALACIASTYSMGGCSTRHHDMDTLRTDLVRAQYWECQRNVKWNVDTGTVSYREVEVGNGNTIGHGGARLSGGHCWEMYLGGGC